MTAAFQLSRFDTSPFGWLMPPSSTNREVNERVGIVLRQARKKAWGVYGSLARTAEMAGVSQGTLSAIERGDHPLSKVRPENLQNFPAAYGMSSQEFAQLTGVTLVIPAEGQIQPTNVRIVDNLRRVPVRTMAAAGNAFYADDAVIDYEHVSADLYRTDMIVVEVVGDSMAPTINNGDRAYVDSHQIEAVEGKMVLASIVGNGMVVKRLRSVLGTLHLASDNPEHGLCDGNKAQIVGTVYYVQPKGRKV